MEKLENTTFGISKIDSKNRITIPSEALDFLKVTVNGYYVSFDCCNNAHILHKAYFVIRRNNNGNGEKIEGSL